MGLSRRQKVLVAVGVVSIAVTIAGMWFGFPFFFVFLFFPGLFGLMGSNRDRVEEREGIRYCPECGYELDEGDSFCKVCGRRLRPVSPIPGRPTAS